METVPDRGWCWLGHAEVAEEGVWRLVSRTDDATGIAAPTMEALVGCEKEIERLAAAFAHARNGNRRGLWITGEAGIGKTSLLKVLRARAPLWLGPVPGLVPPEEHATRRTELLARLVSLSQGSPFFAATLLGHGLHRGSLPSKPSGISPGPSPTPCDSALPPSLCERPSAGPIAVALAALPEAEGDPDARVARAWLERS